MPKPKQVKTITRREDLITFFLHLRKHGEGSVGLTIEQFVDKYIEINPKIVVD